MTTGKWTWAESHEVADFTNWAAGGEPSGGVGEDCVMKVFWRPGWHDTTCDSDFWEVPMHALCEQ